MNTESFNGIISQATETATETATAVWKSGTDHMEWCNDNPLACVQHETWRSVNALLTIVCGLTTARAPRFTKAIVPGLCTMHGSIATSNPAPSLHVLKESLGGLYNVTAKPALALSHEWVWVPAVNYMNSQNESSADPKKREL